MAEAFRESLAGTMAQSMTPDSFLHMLLSREWDYHSQAAVARMNQERAFFRYRAYLEEVDYTVRRGHQPRAAPDATIPYINTGR